MRLTFGLHLDGPVAPEPLAGRSASIGEATCGPERLLGLLETHLGLGGNWQPEPVRVLQYRSRLAAADDGRRFYTQSYRTDPVGTAITLLRWREELIAGGWDGRSGSRAPGRLGDLAAVERVDGTRDLAPGASSRQQEVLRALDRRRPPIDSIRLLDSRALLPPPWPRLLDALARQGCSVSEQQPSPGAAGGNLKAVQEAFARRPAAGADPADRSVIVLRAPSDTVAAEAVVAWLDSIGPGAVVASAAGDDTLDRALRKRGMPIAGVSPSSPWRPALQLLPLAVSMRWEPLDPRRLLEFLLVPGGPLSRSVATKLARAVARSPGVGGFEWKAALNRIEKDVREGKLHSLDGGPRARRGPDQAWREQMNLIEEWILAPRANPETGISRSELFALSGRVASWATAAVKLDPEDEVARAAATQASTVQGMLELVDEQLVPQLLWDALLEQATGHGIQLPRVEAEQGHVPVVHHPGALLGPVERLLWWDFTGEAAARTVFAPWTPQERAQLERSHVMLEEPSRAIERDVSDTARAIRCVTRQLVLVVPALRRGEASSAHPELARVATALGPALAACTANTRERLLDGESPADSAAMEPVQPRRLTPCRRWWRLPRGVSLRGREHETYTSLSDFLNHPFHWVLKYPAALSGGALQPILPTRRLLGNLAHRLLQEALTQPALMAPDAPLRPWLERRMPSLLAEEGALLLLPARQPDRRRLAIAVERSVTVLARQMREGGWRLDDSAGARGMAGIELALQAPFVGGSMEGYLDLLLVNDAGERTVLDLKWGRHKPSEEVPLQLLVYAHLVRARCAGWPRVAHFFLEQASIHPADSLEAAGIPRERWNESACEAQWPACEAAWGWRRSQLDAGTVEVTVTGTYPDEDSRAPAGAREPEGFCRFNEFGHLVGWTEEEGVEEDS